MFKEELENIYKLNDINKTEKFLNDYLEKAIKNNEISLILEVINELIGFYRDITKYDLSNKYAYSLINLLNKINLDDKYIFICYINIANSFRANKLYDEAINYFEKAINLYNESKLDDLINLAALYNNYALLYEELDLKKAINYFYKALDIINIQNDEIKLATTYTNLGFTYIKLNMLKEAYEAILQAKKIFDLNKLDFHASGFYNLYAKYLFLTKDYNESIKYYYLALNNLKRTVGKNLQYLETLDELNLVYKISNIPFNKLIYKDLDFFKENKEMLFKGLNKDDLKHVSISVNGFGSECFLADDVYSMDHDYEIGLVIIVDDSYNKIYETLKINYENLPNTYLGEIRNKLDKFGVFYLSDYLKYINNCETLITNGLVFYGNNEFVKLRDKLISDYKYNRLINIVYKTLEINQIINYNLKRLEKRMDYNTIKLLKNRLLDYLIDYSYLINNKFIPHDKLKLKLIKHDEFYNFILNLLSDSINLEELNNYLINNLIKYQIIKNKYSNYIEDYKLEMLEFVDNYKLKLNKIKEIISIEWNMFQELKNIGGRASCQDNFEYFKLMRESQYIAFNNELLDSYLSDLKKALEFNYNLLYIKYGFMEETVDNMHYNEIKQNLPKLNDKQIKLREAIILVQLEMLESFSKKSSDASLMRSFYTSSDQTLNASYETYLRGELSSYSEKTLYLYANLIKNYTKSDINYVETIINYTHFFNL